MRNINWLVWAAALSLVSETSLYAGDTLLRLAQRKSVSLGSKATETQSDIEQKVRKAEDRVKKKAAELAQNAANLQENARKALEQDLINGKAAIVEELTCALKNVKNNTSVNGSIQLDGRNEAERTVIQLTNLFTGDPTRENMALGFSSFSEDGTTVRFDLIDLNTDETLRSGKFSELGLDDVTSSCGLSKRIVSVREGIVQIDAQTLEKKTISNTKEFVKESVEKARSAQ